VARYNPAEHEFDLEVEVAPDVFFYVQAVAYLALGNDPDARVHVADYEVLAIETPDGLTLTDADSGALGLYYAGVLHALRAEIFAKLGRIEDRADAGEIWLQEQADAFEDASLARAGL
jgi:hypothetical protein